MLAAVIWNVWQILIRLLKTLSKGKRDRYSMRRSEVPVENDAIQKLNFEKILLHKPALFSVGRRRMNDGSAGNTETKAWRQMSSWVFTQVNYWCRRDAVYLSGGDLWASKSPHQHWQHVRIPQPTEDMYTTPCALRLARSPDVSVPRCWLPTGNVKCLHIESMHFSHHRDYYLLNAKRYLDCESPFLSSFVSIQAIQASDKQSEWMTIVERETWEIVGE